MTGVTAFSGMMPASPGRMQMKLQSRAMAPPVSMVTGSRELWLEVPSMRRAMCGTASPIKELGPQVTCTADVDSQVFGIACSQQQGIQRLYQQYGNQQPRRCDQGEKGKLLQRYSSEVSHSPNHVGMHPFCRGEKVEQGDGR